MLKEGDRIRVVERLQGGAKAGTTGTVHTSNCWKEDGGNFWKEDGGYLWSCSERFYILEKIGTDPIFRKNDLVVLVKNTSMAAEIGSLAVVQEDLSGPYLKVRWIRTKGCMTQCDGAYLHSYFKKDTAQTKGGNVVMERKKVIRENFKKSEDEYLVSKHLGSEISDTFIGGLVVKAHSTEILAEANRLEKIEEESKKK